MRRVSLCLFMVVIPALLSAQILATTDSGRRVQLNHDGTWKYVKGDLPTSPSDHGITVQIDRLDYVRSPHGSEVVEIYLDYADLQFRIANNSEQDIRAFRARFILTDLFGDDVFSFEGDVTNPITAGNEIVYGWLFPEGGISSVGGEALRDYRASDLTVAIENVRVVPAD